MCQLMHPEWGGSRPWIHSGGLEQNLSGECSTETPNVSTQLLQKPADTQTPETLSLSPQFPGARAHISAHHQDGPTSDRAEQLGAGDAGIPLPKSLTGHGWRGICRAR